MKTEFEKRDDALNLLETNRKELVKIAKEIAVELGQTYDHVCGPDVIKKLIEKGHKLDGIDRRFIGCVFRDKKTWVWSGQLPYGSHGQRIALWRLRSKEGVKYDTKRT